jgi:hypothetical protein
MILFITTAVKTSNPTTFFNCLTAGCKILLKAVNLLTAQEMFLLFVEPYGSLQCSQKPAV